MVGNHLLEFRHDLARLPARESRVDAHLLSCEALLIEADRGGVQDRRVADVRERRTAPRCQGRVERGERVGPSAGLRGCRSSCRRRFELVGIERIDAEAIPRALGDQDRLGGRGLAARLEQLADSGDVLLQRVLGSVGCRFPPDRVNQ